MPRRRSNLTTRSRGFRPAGDWVGLATSDGGTTVAAATTVIIGSFTVTQPQTVRRVRGMIGVESDQIAASEVQLGAFGLCVVSDPAFAAGAASIPGPITDIDSNLWFVYQPFLRSLKFSTAASYVADFMGEYVIDGKAQRKVTEEETVAVMVENASASTAFKLHMNIRAFFTETNRG